MRSLETLLCSLAVVGSTGCGGGTPAEDPPPNLVLISLDTLRAGHMSLYGYERETTPYLERLAEESVVYDRATSSSCWTLIAHMTMLTGLFPEQHGVVRDGLALSPEAPPLLAQRLQERGYQTIGLYRPGWIHERFGQARGFDVWREHEFAPEAAEHMWEELAGLDPARPFFLFLHLVDIHPPPMRGPGVLYYDPPAPYDSMFVPDAVERLADVNFIYVRDTGTPLPPDQLEAMIALYDGDIRYVDTLLGEWIEEWRRTGILDETLLVITADHGESLGQRNGVISGHGGMYEDALHVPLLMRFPGGELAGERPRARVGHVDILPTVLDYLGFPPDPALPGYSLLEEWPEDRVIFAAKPPHSARVWGSWKLREKDGKHWLYDLDEDPLELAPKRGRAQVETTAATVAALIAAELDGRLETWDPIPAIEMKEALRDELDAMGYAGDD